MQVKGVERVIYRILTGSVIAALIVIAVGLVMSLAKPEVWGETKYGDINPTVIVKLIAKGDPRGVLGLTALTLIAGVLASLVATIVHSTKKGDKTLLIMSTILLILLIASIAIGLIVRVLHK